jgi:hypothetical protein
MNTIHRTVLLGLVVGLSLSPRLLAVEDSTPPKTHLLFLGADLSIQHQSKVYRVEDVTGSALKIKVGRDDVLVPTRQGPVALQVKAGLKLAGTSAVLDELKSGAAYTYANDPMRKLEEANSNAVATADSFDLSVAGADMARANLAAVMEATSHYSAENRAQAEREIAAARGLLERNERQLVTATGTTLSDRPNLGVGALRAAKAEGNYDAMEVSFKVSSATPLDRPYMVVLFRFHDPAAKPGVNGMVIHAQALDPIDASPRYVRVLRGGLPPGFKPVDCSVHLYNRGAEVGTNVSDKRVELTRDEARQYLVMEHLGAHKGETLPAGLVAGSLSRETRQKLTPTQVTQTFYAKVAADGALQGAFADEACATPLGDAGIDAALREAFFVPAVQQGKAAAGVARVRLADN